MSKNVWDGEYRRFGPLEEGDAGLGHRCLWCGEETEVGQYVTLTPVNDRGPHSLNVRAAVGHWDCRPRVKEAPDEQP